jgi:hypothetical protein
MKKTNETQVGQQDAFVLEADITIRDRAREAFIQVGWCLLPLCLCV